MQGGGNFGAKVHTVGTNPASSTQQRKKDALELSKQSPAARRAHPEPGAATVDTIDHAEQLLHQVERFCTSLVAW